MYHDVRPWDANYFPKRYEQKPFITINQFKKHINYLQDNFDIIHPNQIKSSWPKLL